MLKQSLATTVIITTALTLASCNADGKVREIAAERFLLAQQYGICPTEMDQPTIRVRGNNASSRAWMLISPDNIQPLFIDISKGGDSIQQAFKSDHELAHFCGITEYFDPPLIMSNIEGLTSEGNLRVVSAKGLMLVVQDENQKMFGFTLLDEGRAVLYGLYQSQNPEEISTFLFTDYPSYYRLAMFLQLLSNEYGVDPINTSFSQWYQGIFQQPMSPEGISLLAHISEGVSNGYLSPEQGLRAIQDAFTNGYFSK